MLDISETKSGYLVGFAYKPYLVAAIKQIPGARWHQEIKRWKVPLESAGRLNAFARKFNSSMPNAAPQKPIQIGEIDPLPELTVDIDDVIYNREKKAKGEDYLVMSYQKQGIAYASLHERVLIGDEPGLGKTVQAIATTYVKQSKCILVICPATLKDNWKREWKMWTGKEAMILTDRVKESWVSYYKVGMTNVFICNFESLKKFFVESINIPKGKALRLDYIKFKLCISLFDAVIIDESHRCKQWKTQQTKFVMGITRGKPLRLALTGTPIVNKPLDLVSQLYIIGQLSMFGDYKGFTDRYCAGPNFASNLKELNYSLHQNCFYRREKKDVLKDLPDKMRNIVRVDITNRAEYKSIEDEFKQYAKDNKNNKNDFVVKAKALAMLGKLKRISALGKIEAIVEHITEIVEAGQKVGVFAWHKDVVAALKEHFRNIAVTITGDDSIPQIIKAKDSFQNDPAIQVIILNIKSGGVGITLTAASRAFFIELPWHPADCTQCEDRFHRIGQKDSVEARYFLGHNTVDEKIYNIIERKREMVNEAMGSEEDVQTNMVDEFMNLFS